MNNINISGSGKIDEGVYGTIRISGSGKAEGNIKAETIILSGSGKFMGNAQAEKIKVSGSGKFMGKVEADEIKVAGSCHFEKAVKANQFGTSGSCQIDGEIEAEIVKASGIMKVAADMNVDSFEADLHRGSFFQNIFGDKVIIASNGLIEAKEIEATIIDVSNLKAHRISGEKVIVRGDSNIDVVEYAESLDIEDGVIIRKAVKL